MKKTTKKIQDLKEKVAYYASAAPKVAEAYTKKAIGKEATLEEIEFRKSRCESCVLYNLDEKTGRANCNSTKLASDEDVVLDLEFAKRAGYPLISSQGVIKIAVVGKDKYFRGCGCPMSGDLAKYTFHHSESSLELKDGKGPCPRGRWNKKSYEQWKKKKNQ